MKIAERIVMVLIFFCLTGGSAWIYFSVKGDQRDVRDAVARGEYEVLPPEENPYVPPERWRTIYGDTVPMLIGGVPVEVSVAANLESRIKGLSGTPFLPDNVAKLFVFGVLGDHSIWMKDMNYSIDILWVSESGEILHIKEGVSPDSYPESFSSPVPAWYVVETNAGFVSKNGIELGDELLLLNKE